MKDMFALMFDADDVPLGYEPIGGAITDWDEARFKSWAEAIMSTFMHFDEDVHSVGLYRLEDERFLFQGVDVQRD